MQVDWNALSPLTAVAGGAVIGLAAGLLALLNGRIAGISGIVGGLLARVPGDMAWRVLFITGMLASPLVYRLLAPLPPIDIEASPWLLALAGFVVGMGSRYGAGCTSGHGICGISRVSPRSIVATLVFMASGVATVFVIRHLLA